MEKPKQEYKEVKMTKFQAVYIMGLIKKDLAKNSFNNNQAIFRGTLQRVLSNTFN